MIREQHLVQEYITVVNHFYPPAGTVLSHCYVKVIECYVRRQHKRLYYVGIYYPAAMQGVVDSHKAAFREVAENMGLVEVVCLNATRLLRDPMSKLKEKNPRLWLELSWIVR